MRTIFPLAILLIVCTLTKGQITFEKTFNKGSNATGYSVIQTSDSGYAIAAGTGSGDNEKIFLIRTNATGDTLWTRTFSGTFYYVGDHAIIQTADEGFIMCGNMGDSMYLLKTNATGDSLWGRILITGTAISIEKTLDGGYILCGGWNGSILIVKTDSNGILQWIKSYSIPPTIVASYSTYSIKQTQDLGFIITGAEESGYGSRSLLLFKTDSNGDSLWLKTFWDFIDSYGSSVSITADNGYFVCGSYQKSGYDVFVVKFNELGDTLWLRKINDPGSQFLYSCQALAGGDYIACGTTEGPGNTYLIMLMKFSENGDVIWSRTFTRYDKSWGYCVRQTADQGFIITGNTIQTTSGITDVYLIKTDSSGFITGIDEKDILREVKVFPNPATDLATFHFTGTLPDDETQVIIYDLFGKQVMKGTLPKRQAVITLDIRSLAPGFYCYGITQNLNRTTGKLVVVR